MKKFSILFILCISTSFMAQAQEVDMQQVLDSHYERVENYELTPLGVGEQILYNLLEKYSQNRLTPKMLHFFTKNPTKITAFYTGSKNAESRSAKKCQVEEDERHESDEVDAIRHFLWAASLAKNLGAKKALLVMSLQEDRPYNDYLSMKMDLYNNQLAVNFVLENKKDLLKVNARGRNNFNKKIMTQALKYLGSGSLKVIQSKESYCQRAHLYPNLF